MGLSRIFFCFAFTLFSRSRFNFSPSSKLVDPLYHKYSVILFLRLPMDFGCPVSCKFPHGTLHYQSRLFSSSLVGGSTFFHPHFMYEFTRTFRLSSFVRDWFPSAFPFRFFLTSFHLVSFSPSIGFHPSQFRSPLLSVSRLISLIGTKMFQFPTFLSLSCMLSHVWDPVLLSFRFFDLLFH